MHTHLVICEVCGKSRGRWFDHTECSKIKQVQHANDKRAKSDNKYTEQHISGLLKNIGE
jgi:Zn-finger nucleic acid-binding protein